ncbi:MAG: ATP-binding cassette domain-containing protein [Spirochaetota bacterium]
MQNTAIHVRHAHKSFKTLKAVDDLSFKVEKAICFGFLGPNGAGKTTMMKILYGKATPDHHPDTVLNVLGYDPRHQELQIKSLSGVVPQENNLDEELNVVQNLKIYSKFYNMSGVVAEERIDYLLEFMELSDKKKAKIKELSGGMKRRLVIARSLLNNPSLLILDEPTTGLDPQVRQLIWDKLRNLKKTGVTILLTTHYMEEAFQIADNILIMDRGKSLKEGNPKTLLQTEIESHVLEINNNARIDRALALAPKDGCRKEESNERTLFYSNDSEMLTRMCSALEAGDYYLRQVTLEDLFLKATGRNLNESQ